MSRAKAIILCIDDHWKGLIPRKMLLENHGYEVLEASGVDEGLRLFRSRSVDAVLLDEQMPGMDGNRVAKRMKRIHSHVPIMLLSACAPLGKAKLRSVDSFLAKSEPPNILLSTLEGLLDGQRKPFFLRWLDQWRDQNRSHS
jgi:CheY-like chemotaxis protein